MNFLSNDLVDAPTKQSFTACSRGKQGSGVVEFWMMIPEDLGYLSNGVFSVGVDMTLYDAQRLIVILESAIASASEQDNG